MSLTWKIGVIGLVIFTGGAGCSMIHTHPDCDQVAQQQRAGVSDEEVAKSIGFTLADVQSCSETGSSGERETANNFQDRPQLPVMIPNIPGSIGAPSFH
jgi:hypothetical protein